MKTIFSRFMAFSVGVVLFSTILFFAVSMFFINEYAVDTHTATLVKNSERISALTDFLYRNYNDMSNMLYIETLNTMANSTETYIVLTDSQGNIVTCSQNARRFLENTGGIIDVSGFSRSGNGQTVVKANVFNNLFGGRILTVSTQVGYGGRGQGYVLMNYPMPFIAIEAGSVAYLLFICGFISIFVCLVFSYIMSRKISRPVSDLCISAQRIAQGDFNQRNVDSNIQEISELSNSFNTMAEELGKIDQSRSDFISNVSHDLRTPMTSISGFVDGILDGTIPPESQEKYLKIVSGEVKRLSNLVNVFLDTSRYEMGEINLNITQFNICEVVRTVIAAQESAITEKEINLDLNFSQENITASGDEASIHRVVANLVDNATKFCNVGGNVTVRVEISGKKVVTTIENTGETISDEDKKYIWDRFYKTDKSRAKDKKGSGLGLFIVKNIITQHGEKILLKSEEGVTSFTFALPMAKS